MILLNNCCRLIRLTLLLLPVLALLIPATAMAELQPLDDGTLSAVTGQGGVTIELETKLNIDRLTWTDEGSLNVNNLRLSGHNNTVLDNLKLTVDVAGAGEVLAHGFSEKKFNSGDLVIHLGATDYGDPTSLQDYLRAVDFELEVGSITAEGSEGSASLFSDVLLQGYIGPTDLVIRNQGGSTKTLSNGNTVSGAELQLDTHFEITNGSLNWDAADVILLFNFAAVGIEGLQIHNRRGADTEGHFGMASATANLSRGKSSVSGETGLSIHDVEFRADIDMPVFKVGGTSIGNVQFTDFAITDTTMMVYGH